MPISTDLPSQQAEDVPSDPTSIPDLAQLIISMGVRVTKLEDVVSSRKRENTKLKNYIESMHQSGSNITDVAEPISDVIYQATMEKSSRTPVLPKDAHIDTEMETEMPTTGVVPEEEESSSSGENSREIDTDNDMNDFEFPAYYKRKLESLERRQKKLERLTPSSGLTPTHEQSHQNGEERRNSGSHHSGVVSQLFRLANCST